MTLDLSALAASPAAAAYGVTRTDQSGLTDTAQDFQIDGATVTAEALMSDCLRFLDRVFHKNASDDRATHCREVFDSLGVSFDDIADMLADAFAQGALEHFADMARPKRLSGKALARMEQMREAAAAAAYQAQINAGANQLRAAQAANAARKRYETVTPSRVSPFGAMMMLLPSSPWGERPARVGFLLWSASITGTDTDLGAPQSLDALAAYWIDGIGYTESDLGHQINPARFAAITHQDVDQQRHNEQTTPDVSPERDSELAPVAHDDETVLAEIERLADAGSFADAATTANRAAAALKLTDDGLNAALCRIGRARDAAKKAQQAKRRAAKA